MEIAIALKNYVHWIYCDKAHFDEHLDTRPEFGLSPEDVQICKGLLLDFYTIGFKRKEDLRTHDLGLVSKVRHRNTKTLHTYCSTWGILVCCV